MAQKTDNSPHWLIGTLLLVSGVLIITTLVSTKSLGQSNQEPSNFNVNVLDIAPTITDHVAWQFPQGGSLSTFNFSTVPYATLTGIVAGSTQVIVNVNVTDPNGYSTSNINLQARLVRSTQNGTNVGPHIFDINYAAMGDWIFPLAAPVNCVNIATISDLVHRWQCSINMIYLGDSTVGQMDNSPYTNYSNEHWRMAILAMDDTSFTEDTTTIHFEWPNIIGLAADSSVFLGQLVIGGAETSLANLNVHNRGNTMIDVTTTIDKSSDAAAWNCGVGNGIPLVSDVHHSIPGGPTDYASMNALTLSTSSTNYLGFDFDRYEQGNEYSNSYLSFKMKTSQQIAPGTCTLSSMILTAIQGF